MDMAIAIEAVVDGIEHELKNLDLWNSKAPPIAALSSEQRSCYEVFVRSA